MHHLPSFNPLFGLFAGLLHLVFVLAVIGGLVFLLVSLLKRRDRPGSGGNAKNWGVFGYTPDDPHSPGGHGKSGRGWHHRGPRPPFEALRILDERFARSELDVDDYLTRRTVLLGGRPNGMEYDPGAGTEPPGPGAPNPGPPSPQTPGSPPTFGAPVVPPPATPPATPPTGPSPASPTPWTPATPESPPSPSPDPAGSPASEAASSPVPDAAGDDTESEQLPPRLADWLTPDQEAESEPRRPSEGY